MHRITHNPLALMLIVTTVGAAGQLLLKFGMLHSTKAPTLIGIIRIMITQPLVLGGLVLFALNTVIYLRVLQQYPLSLVYPMIAFSYVVVTVLAWAFLGEKIPPLRLLGLATISLGVLLLAASARSPGSPDSSAVDAAPSGPAAPPLHP